MSIAPANHRPNVEHKVNILGAHWSMNNIHSEGTGVKWNKKLNLWEVKVVRTIGHYATAAEAGEAMDAHINGVEEWFIQQIELAERKLLADGKVR